MAGTTIPRRLIWHIATVDAIMEQTPRVKDLVLSVPEWPGHLPGQHVDVRLTAEDGYQAERSYSIATAPDGPRIELTVERLDDGEVSPYLVDDLQPGDHLELRGPIGGYFIWDVSDGGPLLLIGGGSGIVPLMAMLRHRSLQRSQVPTRLLYSSRSCDEIIYREELANLSFNDGNLDVINTLTRTQPPGWTRYRRRVDREMVAEVAWPPADRPLIYICGPTPFVEAVASACVALGHDPQHVKTERFGPTG